MNCKHPDFKKWKKNFNDCQFGFKICIGFMGDHPAPNFFKCKYFEIAGWDNE